MGLLHIYAGDGKGKTTAAMGLALRALGNGMQVCVCQFLKGGFTGEIEALARFENARVLRAGAIGFLWEMAPQHIQQALAAQRELLGSLARVRADLIVCDEALDAMRAGAFSQEELLDAVEALLARAEVVLTGREAPGGARSVAPIT